MLWDPGNYQYLEGQNGFDLNSFECNKFMIHWLNVTSIIVMVQKYIHVVLGGLNKFLFRGFEV